MMEIYDDRRALHGEGALWHPTRNELFWFDMYGQKLLSDHGREDQFDEVVSAAGWVDENSLLIASETALSIYNLTERESAYLVALEFENETTRSNDGRADPFGGFWISTMGKNAQTGAGAIYRYYEGELHTLYQNMTIPNAISFSPDGNYAFFTDTTSQIVKRVALGDTGFPTAAPEAVLDLRAENRNPDGMVVDIDGNFILAEWGSSRVAVYDADGIFIEAFATPTQNVSCPAMGGENLDRLFCTTSQEHLDADTISREPAGAVFSIATNYRGQREHQVII